MLALNLLFIFIFDQYAGSEPNATFLSLRPGDQLSNTTLNTPTGGVNMRIMQDEKTLWSNQVGQEKLTYWMKQKIPSSQQVEVDN